MANDETNDGTDYSANPDKNFAGYSTGGGINVHRFGYGYSHSSGDKKGKYFLPVEGYSTHSLNFNLKPSYGINLNTSYTWLVGSDWNERILKP